MAAGLAAGSGATIVHSADGDRWTEALSFVSAPPWERGNVPGAVAWNGDRFVAVGERGAIMHSADGDRWFEALDSGIAANYRDLQGVAWTGERFVAVGEHGTIVHSRDGDRWQASESPVREQLVAVAANESHIVAVGRNGTIVVSP